jgi:hypothetical protein
MDNIRQQLGRAVSRASISIAASEDFSVKNDQQGKRKEKSTPPRQSQQFNAANQSGKPSPPHDMSPDAIHPPIESSVGTPPGVRAQIPGPLAKNPYAKGATRISRDIVAKAGLGVAMTNQSAAGESHDDDSETPALVAPQIDTSLKARAQIPGMPNHDSQYASRSIISSPQNSSDKGYRQQRLQAMNQALAGKTSTASSNQSSARDTEALTPLSDNEDDNQQRIPSIAYERKAAVKPRLKSAPVISHQSASAPISRRESSASVLSTLSADAKPAIASSVYSSKRSSPTAVAANKSTVSAGRSSLQAQEKPAPASQDSKDEPTGWLCLKCNKENRSADYDKFCAFCATVRGSTGQKGVLAPLNRHH